MEQNTFDPHTAKLIACVAQALPPLSKKRMQFLIQNPSLLTKKLYYCLVPGETKSRDRKNFLETTLDELPISIRLRNCLKGNDIKVAKDILALSADQIELFKKFGTGTYWELIKLFAANELTLPI